MKTGTSIQPPILLKTILDIFFWLTLLGLIFKTIFTFFYWFTDIDIPVMVTINDLEVNEFSLSLGIGILFKMIISAVFIYIIYLLRKVVRSFFKRKVFTPLQIAGLKLIGQLIIITALAEVGLNFFLRLVLEQRASVGLRFETSFDSLWFSLALGLFFILLSKSFSYARSVQEENELTV
ncbi:DUF2975 domain-containing protein [Antarcticibacterium sp. 1MA-6-2]|uniref:DUF2975 domain-containing protein n=1 Tax=Antarcticibacterium sp. 1MA-6-2 TaxID=2908210 RepID=UPI001F19B03E|nr:DUF2975 domain-containing protein [Antarcticibacterium sp. 1MA-6-2]UJH89957.1 DUF2975 domain-containing protein [Antarcticibacterium sp. 1MA-6-2]